MSGLADNVADVDLVRRALRRYGEPVLSSLLRDRSTGGNIIWASSEYEVLGEGFRAYDEVTVEHVAGARRARVEPRVAKAAERQVSRTRSRAEVFTPSWLCSRMVDAMDDAFLDVEPDGSARRADIVERLGDGARWRDYVDNRLLEITCGEAPFVCSPYDATTGDFLAVPERIGFLDRKLRVVTAFAADEDEWLKWALRALESTYGYEFQGDNLLVARINALDTLADHMEAALGRRPTEREARRAALVASWNLWQMDGLTGCAPSEWDVPESAPAQMSLFDGDAALSPESQPKDCGAAVPCRVFDWRARKSQAYTSLKDSR